MDHTCKNCGQEISNAHNYCHNCGAKVVEGRLTVKNLLADVVESYLNLDNNFIKTFIEMFGRPHRVIDGYIQGIRRRYKNPVSYLAIALTLSGIIVFLLQALSDNPLPPEFYGNNMSPQLAEKLMPIMFDYSSLMFILYIPIFAFAGYLTFNRKGYNFLEYNVVFLFSLGHYSIASFPVALVFLLISPMLYWETAFYSLAIMFLFSVYCMQMINRFKAAQLVLRAFTFLMLAMIGYFGIIILFYIVLFITGTITLEDFKPVEQALYATSSCINCA